MPLKITNGNGYLLKKYGIHNGSTCVLQKWELAEADIAAFRESRESQIVSTALPAKLIVKMDRPLKKQYEGLEENCFPLSPVTVYWTLDEEETLKLAGVIFQLCLISVPRSTELQAEH